MLVSGYYFVNTIPSRSLVQGKSAPANVTVFMKETTKGSCRGDWMLWMTLLWALLLFPGCGYHFGSLMPENAKTISVEILNNNTFWRGLEVTLTAEIADEIASRTPLILTERKDADLLLKGTIVSFRKAVLLEDVRDDTLESAVVAIVDVELIDLRNNKTVKQFTVSSSPNKSTFMAAEESVKKAINESFADMAERIVYKVQEGF